MQGKAGLRASALARRAALGAPERARAAERIATALSQLLDSGPYAAYCAVGSEPVVPVGPGVLLPVLLPDGDLDWATGPVAGAPRGLQEPTGARLGVDAIASCAVVLVPALAADRTGTRLGRGGGSYDRALRRATGLTVAVLYDDELVSSLPAEAHDVPVRAVVTPSYGLLRL
jgi:5-formyltetrahydrofolate cyclo-ligase